MKCNINIKSTTLLLVVSLLSLTACKKNNTNLSNADDNGGYASDNAKMENNSNDIVSISDAAYASGSATNTNLRTTQTTLGGCVTITLDTTDVPHVLTINFGTTDCICLDGKNRKGEIIVTFDGHYKDSGSTHTITYNNYYVNDNQLTGSKTVTNNGTNSQGQVYYTVSGSDTLNLGTGNGYLAWTANHTRTWTAGYSTAIRSDDVYSISGSSTLTRANGHVFTLTITTPLVAAMDCAWIESGIINVTGSTVTGTRSLDYGDGNCDDEAQLTINNHTYNITLH